MNVFNRDVRPGDVLVNYLGHPCFRVTKVQEARKRGYLVFSGHRLRPETNKEQGGYQFNMATIDRPEASC